MTLIAFNICVVAFTAIALVTDVRAWRLPNWLTVGAFFAGILFHAVLGYATGGGAGVVDHLLFAAQGFGVGFGLLFVMWLIGSGSAGDAKLMGAIGVWLGPIAMLGVLILSGIIELGRMLIVFFIRSAKRGMRGAMEEMKRPETKTRPGETPKKQLTKLKLPYAVSAILATWIVLIVGSLVTTPQTSYWKGAPRAAKEGSGFRVREEGSRKTHELTARYSPTRQRGY